MSRQNVQNPENSRRLLASAVGMAVATLSAPHMAQAADATDSKAISLGATSITGEVKEDTSYKTEKSASTKYTAPLVDTPRSVTVIPQQVLKDTAALNLQDALRTVPGITFGAGEGGNPQGDRPIIRGFDAQGDTYIDGVRDTGAQSREIFDIESIEVSKGPNSAMGGRGSAGGSLNLVSKMPKENDFTDAGFVYGSDQTRRYTLDVNRKFLDTAAFRLNLMSHEQNVSGRQSVNYDRWGVAPSLTFGLGTENRLNLSYYHMESNDLPDSGVPYGYASGTTHKHDKPDNGGDSSNFYGLNDRDFRKTRADISTISFEHDFNEDMTLKNTFRHGNSGQDYILTQPDDSKLNVPRYGTVWRRGNTLVSTTETTTNQTDLYGDFRLLGLKNSYSTGVEITREVSRSSSYNITNANGTALSGLTNCSPTGNGNTVVGNCTSLSDPNPNDAYGGVVSRNYATTQTDANTRSAYVFDTIELTPQWLINLGSRFDSFHTNANSPTAHASSDSNFWNWQAGVTWKPAQNGSVYASFATSATPPGGLVGQGSDGNPLTAGAAVSDLQPETTKNYEVGTKWDVLNERVSLTAAVFRTEKTNTRVLTSANVYENAGESRVDGVELSASGKITDKWQVFAGYSYLDSELVSAGLVGRNGAVTAGAASQSGNRMPNVPKNSGTLWTTYQLAPKLTIGGGAFYVGEVYGDTGNTVYVPSYTRFDAMASYKLNKTVDFQVNVQNLTDKLYYDKAFAAHFANQAAGRTVLFSTNVHF